MIITLKGANFSSNNIGTLNTYSITTSLMGMTSNNTTKYVEKGGSYNAIFTENDGCDLITSQTFTMGGVDLLTLTNADGSNMVTYYNFGDNGPLENKYIEVNIKEVTGNIYIKLSAIKTSIDPSNPNLPDTPDDETITFTQITGYYIADTGEAKASSNWNTTDYIAVNANSVYTYWGDTSLGSGSVQAVYCYNSEKTPIKALLKNIDGSNGYVFETTNDTAYIKISSHKDTALKLEYTPNALQINYITSAYVSKTGELATANGWTRTDYILVRNVRSVKYFGTVPEGGLSTVAAIYGYDSDKNPIEMVLAPSTTAHIDGYAVTLTNDNIKYIVACGYTKNGEAFSVTAA